MLACDTKDAWTEFLDYIKQRCSPTAYGNWFAPIRVLEASADSITLEVPNVFVQQYLIDNYSDDLKSFLPVREDGSPAIEFVVSAPEMKKQTPQKSPQTAKPKTQTESLYEIKLNEQYRFSSFIEGPSNQFVKSAAMGVAARPGHSYNPLFIHGGVGLGKTHILHSIGHAIREKHKHLVVQCISTEGFINDLVDSLRNKSVDKLKRFYRSGVDVLLFDDIQFLQNRLNFEEEICNTFEALIHQKKQIVITSDKPPGELQLASERIRQRLEWGLVARMGTPDLETRMAILMNKAEQKGLEIPNNVAFLIAEHMQNNVRQLEGVVNRLSAQCRLFGSRLTEEMVETILQEMLHHTDRNEHVTIDQILKTVCTVFQVKLHDLTGTSRLKSIAVPRQVAMYLAKTMINDSLTTLGAFFGKTHSTILHACKTIEKKIPDDDALRRRIDMVKRSIKST